MTIRAVQSKNFEPGPSSDPSSDLLADSIKDTRLYKYKEILFTDVQRLVLYQFYIIITP